MTSGRRLAAALAPGLASLWCRTWRLREVRPDGSSTGAATTRLRPAIYVLWHAHLLPLGWRHRGEGAAVLVSRHRDGELVARWLERLGYAAVRGSSTRGGAEGLREMVRRAREEERPLAFTPDGPRGPARRCKPGAILAAAATGLPIVPAAAAARGAWRLSSWDAFLLPVPGTTVYVSYGPPLRVPAGAEPGRWQREVERSLDRLTESCERVARRHGRSA